MKLQIMMAVVACSMVVRAQEAPQPDQAAELAKKLANPVAALISIPLQYNYDENIGPNGEGSKSVPVNAIVSQMLKVGSQILQVSLGARYWAEHGDNGPEDWGVRAAVTFLFPR